MINYAIFFFQILFYFLFIVKYLVAFIDRSNLHINNSLILNFKFFK